MVEGRREGERREQEEDARLSPATATFRHSRRHQHIGQHVEAFALQLRLRDRAVFAAIAAHEAELGPIARTHVLELWRINEAECLSYLLTTRAVRLTSYRSPVAGERTGRQIQVKRSWLGAQPREHAHLHAIAIAGGERGVFTSQRPKWSALPLTAAFVCARPLRSSPAQPPRPLR